MKKSLKIALIIAGVFIIIVTSLVVWQWNNIKALYLTFTYSQEEIDNLAKENDEKIKEILSELTESEMTPLTEEEIAKFSSGELSEEEALDIIKNGRKNHAENPDDTTIADSNGGGDGSYESLPGSVNDNTSGSNPGSTNDNSPKKTGSGDKNNSEANLSTAPDKGKTAGQPKQPNVNSNNKQTANGVDDIIARIYLLRAEYVGALGSLEAEALAVMKAMPSSEATASRKLDYVDTYTSRAVALEGQCDSRMESLLGELDSELKRTGGNRAMISQIRSAYNSEKEIKKSQLMSKYSKYL